MVSGSISLPSPGFFSPFPHGTRSLSVAAEYSALDRGRPGFGQGSSCPALLRYRIMELRRIPRTRLSRSTAGLPMPFRYARTLSSTGHPHAALQPRPRRFGLLPFRSPLLGESLLISSPGLLRWFTSSGLAPAAYFIRPSGRRDLSRRVTPFGDPRITGYVPLPADFRGLSRPSSPRGSTGIRHEPIFAWPYPSSRLPAIGGTGSFLTSLFPSLLPVKDRASAQASARTVSVMENRGFEPLTLGLQSRCSSQLS